MFWIYVPVKSNKIQTTFWAFFFKRFIIWFFTHSIHKSISCHIVSIAAFCTIPCNWDPSSSIFYAFILIQFDCLCATFRTFFFDRITQYIFNFLDLLPFYVNKVILHKNDYFYQSGFQPIYLHCVFE